MAIAQLESPLYKAVFAAGATSGTPGEALDSGLLYIYTVGGTYSSSSDQATVWSDKAKTSVLSQPISLDASGEKEIWFDGTYDIRVESSTTELQYTLTGVQSSVPASTTGNYNLVQNGSFEVDTDNDGAPNNWTLVPEASATIMIDASSGGQVHGDNGLKFTGIAAGGGTATSDFFQVLTNSNVDVKFTYKTTQVTSTNSVVINWFQFDDSVSSTASTTIYTATTAALGNSTSFVDIQRRASVPSDAVKAKIVLTGVANGGTNQVGPTWFDNIVANQSTLSPILVGTSVLATKYLTITNIPAGFDFYTVTVDSYVGDSADQMRVELSDDNGSTWKGGTDYSDHLHTMGDAAATYSGAASSGAAYIRVGNGGNALDGYSGEFTFYDLDNASKSTRVVHSGVNELTASVFQAHNGLGALDLNIAINAIRIYGDATTTAASGTMHIYGHSLK